MKLKRFIVLLLSLTLFFTCVFCTACNSSPKELCVQLTNRYENGEVARCIWDMYLKDNKIYLGGGDYDTNSGPTDICAYDLKKKEIVVTGRIQDEAVLTFKEIDGQLYAPGTDPRSSSSNGDFYTLSEDGWKQHKVLPRTKHNFDLIKFEDKLYAGIGGDYTFNPIVVSEDGGETFDFIPLYKNGEELPPLDEPNFSRCYDFYTLNGKLYSLLCFYIDGAYTFEIYCLQDGKMQFVTSATTLDFTKRAGHRVMSAKQEYNGKLYVITDSLYSSENGSSFNKITLLNNEVVSDFIIENDVMYVLSFNKLTDDTFDINIYTYNLNDGEIELFKSFNYEVPALSFIKVKKSFYLGMGNSRALHEKNGTLIKL